ncbi:ribosomal protein S18 acetylase RimI-like enzyme [Catenulispora sp. GP43]|uniref:GNAT family N-acetyltransferase n=1 Tax=Catenulispora sp. GP43 TaxID=3156263 RepID=UPI003519B39F
MTTKPTRNVRLDPMTADEYPAWEAVMVSGFAAAQVREGHWAAATARQQALDVTRGLLPAGVESHANHLWTARDAQTEREIGALWIAMRELGPALEAFIYDIHVSPDAQGEGYGRAIMQAGAAAARALGAETVALNVHGANDRAYQLYKSLGYTVTNRHMRLGL